MSRDDFNERLKRIGASDTPPPRSEPQATARPLARKAPEASTGAKIGRVAGGLAGFALGTIAAVANSLYREAVGTTAEADLLIGLVVFVVGTGLMIILAAVALIALLFGKRWWGIWAFCGGYLVAFGIAGFTADLGF